MEYSVYINSALSGSVFGRWKRVGRWKRAARVVQAVQDCRANGHAARVEYTYSNGRTVTYTICVDGAASETVWHPAGEVALQYSSIGNTLGLYGRRV